MPYMLGGGEICFTFDWFISPLLHCEMYGLVDVDLTTLPRQRNRVHGSETFCHCVYVQNYSLHTKKVKSYFISIILTLPGELVFLENPNVQV